MRERSRLCFISSIFTRRAIGFFFIFGTEYSSIMLIYDSKVNIYFFTVQHIQLLYHYYIHQYIIFFFLNDALKLFA